MHLKKSRLKPYVMRRYHSVTSDEGIKKVGYSEEIYPIRAEIWPASGRVQAEIYGQKLAYILNANVEKFTEIAERDGICLVGNQVTHKVISIKEYTNHKVLELEDVRNHR